MPRAKSTALVIEGLENTEQQTPHLVREAAFAPTVDCIIWITGSADVPYQGKEIRNGVTERQLNDEIESILKDGYTVQHAQNIKIIYPSWTIHKIVVSRG